MQKIILASGSLGRRTLLESIGLKFEVIESNVDEEKIVDTDPIKMACRRAEAKAKDVAGKILNQNQRAVNSKQKTVPSGTVNDKYSNIRNNPLEIRMNPSTDRSQSDNVLVIGADTVGFMDDWVFNKPKSRAEAEEMMARLSGKTHKYVSGHCIVKILSNTNKYYPILTNTNKKNNVIPAKAGILDPGSFISKKNLVVRDDKNEESVLNPLEIRMNPTVIEKITDYDISSVTFRKLSKEDIAFYLDRVDYLKLCGAFKITNSPQNFVTKTEGSLSNIIGLSLEKIIPVLN